MKLKAISLGLLILFLVALFTVAQTLPSGAMVRGRVVYEDTGQPLRRAWVGLVRIGSIPGMEQFEVSSNSANYKPKYASNMGYDSDEYVVLTDDNGGYVIKDVEPGIYAPLIKQPGIWNPDRAEVIKSGLQRFTISGTEELEVNLVAKRGGVIEGRIGYQDGSPVPGVSVTVRKNEAERDEDGEVVTTDDRGIYRVAGLAPGDYTVSAAEPVVHFSQDTMRYDQAIFSQNSILRYFYPGAYSEKKAEPVSVGLSEVKSNIDITLPNHRLATVSGVVVSKKDNRPIGGMKVLFSTENSVDSGSMFNNAREVETDEYGNWSFQDLLPGSYEISASGRGPIYGLLPSDSETEPMRYASTKISVEVVEGLNEGLIISMVPAASIKGTITYENARPEGEMSNYYFVSAIDIETGNRDFAFSADRNDDGEDGEQPGFMLRDLSPGDYRLSVSSSSGPYVRSIMYGGRDITEETIRVEEGESIKGVSIILATDFATLKGKISNAVIPIGREVYLVPVNRKANAEMLFTDGDIDSITERGTFELRAKPGKYFIVVKEFPERPDKMDQEIVKRVFEEWTSGAETIELKAGETVEKTVRID